MIDSVRRPLALAAAMATNLCLGGIYAWSTFVPALQSQFGYTAAATQTVFGICVATLTVASVVSGRLMPRVGPRFLTVAGGLLLGAGYLVAGFLGGTFPFLVLGVGIFGGTGVGMGYVCVIAVAVRWMPKRAGLASGLVVSGYAGASIVLSTVVARLLANSWDVLAVFRVVGIAYGVLVTLGGLMLVMPDARTESGAERIGIGELLHDRRFWAMAAGIFAATLPGLTVIGHLRPIGAHLGMGEAVAVGAISALAVGSIAGRLAWGALHDRIGGRRALLIHLVCVAASLPGIQLCTPSGAGGYAAAVVFTGFCYGGALALYPAQVVSDFGPRLVGLVYPFVLVSHGVAALAGAPVSGRLFDATGSYAPGFWTAAGVAALGFVAVAVLMRGARAAPHPSLR